MGDEVRRTQHGNNNAYCQHNETSWLDWTLVAKHADVRRFATLLIRRRLLRDLEAEYEGATLNQWDKAPSVPCRTYRAGRAPLSCSWRTCETALICNERPPKGGTMRNVEPFGVRKAGGNRGKGRKKER